MEYIDIVDEKGNKTGEVRSREDVHKHGLLYRSVHVWCVNSQNEILLQKRSLKVKNLPGKWDISIGGLVPSGKEVLDAIKMEALEEIGITINEDDLKFLGITRENNILNNGTYIQNGICYIYLIEVDLKIGEFKLNKDEVSELKWVSIQDFQKMVEEKNPELVPHWEEYDILINKLK